jgi:hypothetical protein
VSCSLLAPPACIQCERGHARDARQQEAERAAASFIGLLQVNALLVTSEDLHLGSSGISFNQLYRSHACMGVAYWIFLRHGLGVSMHVELSCAGLVHDTFLRQGRSSG